MWVVLTPIVSTGIGLVYAVLVDRARFEKFAKALLFLPMAISMVGASIIWKFVYDYKSGDQTQIGLLNQILVWLHLDTFNFLLTDPWNTLFLIVILIWIQAGFAMTILSASIKAIPDDIVEAARLDGVGGFKMFRYITVPSIRPSLIVVLTTITIATLKVFDIVQTATGGNFNTSVLAYEFYRQNFVAGNQGLATAIAVVIFLLVVPSSSTTSVRCASWRSDDRRLDTHLDPAGRARHGPATPGIQRPPATASPAVWPPASRWSSRSCGRSPPSACWSRPSGPRPT